MTGAARRRGTAAPSADGNNVRRQQRNDLFLLGARPTGAGPIAGAGLPFLAVGYGVYWLIKRRRKTD